MGFRVGLDLELRKDPLPISYVKPGCVPAALALCRKQEQLKTI